MPEKTCSFRIEYTSVGNRKPVEYCCQRIERRGEYCELHSKELWKQEPEMVKTALKEEIRRSSNAAGHICCIGFHLPDIDLSGRRFDKPVYFQHTVFHGEAVFSNAVFGEVSFRECVFERQASFDGAHFNKDADFLHMEARKRLSFAYAAFFALALLGICTIQNGDFQYAKFSVARIRGTEFKRPAYFNHAEFNGHCDLSGSSFDDVSFLNARFTTASIVSVKFRKADFGRVTFEHPEDVHFDSDLTQASFRDTNLSRIRFGSGTVWGPKDDPVPYDVREFKKGPGRARLADVLAVLRDLRENREYYLEYEGAGKLFVEEMEMRRKYRDSDGGARLRPRWWRLLSLTAWYRHLCMYGESLRRPVLWLLPVFVGSVLFFCIDETFEDMGTCPLEDHDRLSYALTRALSGLLQFGCQAPPDYLLRALSIPILGTIFVALRRKFERRFRH